MQAKAQTTRRHSLWRIDWTRVSTRYLPFADAASDQLPLLRLLRLSLFQVTVGMATALIVGTLNRVMIVELGIAAWVVSTMVALPLLAAPFRALIGFRSDTHRSVLGWRRVPYIWIGTWLMFSGLAIMPFALILLSGDTHWPLWFGQGAAALAFVLVGAGVQTTQTAGLALATDLAPEDARPRVVALMYVMLLVGMVISGIAFGFLLESFSQVRLIKVVQAAAAVAMILNLVALWKQEPRQTSLQPRREGGRFVKDPRPSFLTYWRRLSSNKRFIRYLVTVGLGTAAFNMQDIILEPYGGEILKLGVAETSRLTALSAAGALLAFGLASRWLSKGHNPYRMSGNGIVVGVIAFSCVIFAEPLHAPNLFRLGAALIGFGGGLFSVGTLTIAMGLDVSGSPFSNDAAQSDGQSSGSTREMTGLAIGAWGAVQATCGGLAVAMGGAIRDGISGLATQGYLGEALMSPATGYSFVYHLELLLLFIALVALGPLVRPARSEAGSSGGRSNVRALGLADLPG